MPEASRTQRSATYKVRGSRCSKSGRSVHLVAQAGCASKAALPYPPPRPQAPHPDQQVSLCACVRVCVYVAVQMPNTLNSCAQAAHFHALAAQLAAAEQHILTQDRQLAESKRVSLLSADVLCNATALIRTHVSERLTAAGPS